MTSPAQRTNDKLKKAGCTSAIVEKWNPYVGPPKRFPTGANCACGRPIYHDRPTGIRQDLWGIADVIAIEPGKPGALLVQTCAGKGAVSKHLAKILASDALLPWLEAGNRFVIYSWAKRMVEKRERWTCVETPVTLAEAKEASCAKTIPTSPDSASNESPSSDPFATATPRSSTRRRATSRSPSTSSSSEESPFPPPF